MGLPRLGGTVELVRGARPSGRPGPNRRHPGREGSPEGRARSPRVLAAGQRGSGLAGRTGPRAPDRLGADGPQRSPAAGRPEARPVGLGLSLPVSVPALGVSTTILGRDVTSSPALAGTRKKMRGAWRLPFCGGHGADPRRWSVQLGGLGACGGRTATSGSRTRGRISGQSVCAPAREVSLEELEHQTVVLPQNVCRA